MEAFLEISVLLLIATAVAFILRFLKQPLIVGYILAGILVGPSVFGLISSFETVELFSKFGITILLFVVGLHLSPQVIKEVGTVSAVTGIGQVIFTSLVGYVLARLLGVAGMEAVFVAIALTFSSTIIVLKLLSDKGDMNSLYGKISIGFLLVQDVIATFLLIAVSTAAQATEQTLQQALLDASLKGIAITLIMILVTRFILPTITRVASKNTELLFLFTLSWGLSISAAFYLLGFSIEIGALAAGIALSASDYADEISSRMRPLRDFFIVLFFVLLGSQMQLEAALVQAPAILILSAFVLIGNPLIVLVLMQALGYHRRTGFMAGLTVAQISEFSLILMALGAELDIVHTDSLTLVTMVGLITIAGSTYMLLYSEQLYSFLEPILKKIPQRKTAADSSIGSGTFDIFIFGFLEIGHRLSPLLTHSHYRAAIVDFNPDVVDKLKAGDTQTVFYGDAGNVEFLSELPLQSSKVIISTLPAVDINTTLLKHLESFSSKPLSIFFADSAADAQKLYAAGASYVVLYHTLGADHVLRLIQRVGFKKGPYTAKKKSHLKIIEELLLEVK